MILMAKEGPNFNCLLFGLFVFGCKKGERASDKPITFCVDPEKGLIQALLLK